MMPVDALVDRARVVVTPQEGDHRRLDDRARDGVRQHAFQPVADLDPHLMLGWGDQQQHAVVLLLLPELPETEQPVRVVLDGCALERGHGRDHDLVRALRLLRRQLLVERRLRARIEHARLVHHPPGQRREGEVGPGGKRRHEGEQKAKQGRLPAPA